MTDIDEQSLEAIKQRAAAATPGPWEGDPVDGIGQRWSRPTPWLDVIAMEGSDSWGGCNHRLTSNDADASFIAHSREDIPWLIERLQEAEAGFKEMLQRCEDSTSEEAWAWRMMV